jgi:PAS domain S-box-containing protein
MREDLKPKATSPERPMRDARATMTETGDLYRLLVDRVQDYAIFALDPEGYILTWNAGAERLKQYTPQEAIGQHFSVFYEADSLAAREPERELETAIAVGKVDREGWRLRKDGSRFWANVLITALRDDQGVLVGFAKVTRDLSERRAAEEAIRQSEERFELLIQSVKDYAIFMLDPLGRIATWNVGARNIKGYSPSEIIGKHFSIFYPTEDVAAGKPARELEIAIRTGVYEEEGWRIRKDGSRFWANVVITPVILANGQLAGFAKVTRDLTEQRAADVRALEDARRLAAQEAARSAAEQRAHELRVLAEQLRAQTEELERRSREAESANRAKAEFLAAMSHELRTPLNAIGGYTQLMQMGISGPVTGDQREQLERIQRSQQHLLGIINDILNFSRIEAGHVSYEITEVPIADVVGAVSPMIAVQTDANHLELKIGRCPPQAVARADRAKVEQILLNLLSNAVKFTPAGGRIAMTCDVDEDRVRIRVTDSGIGIPAAQLETIFAPFVQVGRTLASPKEGTGLGLAISRDLARAMKGDLMVESQEGAGSTFTLVLPRA